MLVFFGKKKKKKSSESTKVMFSFVIVTQRGDQTEDQTFYESSLYKSCTCFSDLIVRLHYKTVAFHLETVGPVPNHRQNCQWRPKKCQLTK